MSDDVSTILLNLCFGSGSPSMMLWEGVLLCPVSLVMKSSLPGAYKRAGAMNCAASSTAESDSACRQAVRLGFTADTCQRVICWATPSDNHSTGEWHRGRCQQTSPLLHPVPLSTCLPWGRTPQDPAAT